VESRTSLGNTMYSAKIYVCDYDPEIDGMRVMTSD
jgi:hypothetical protein